MQKSGGNKIKIQSAKKNFVLRYIPKKAENKFLLYYDDRHKYQDFKWCSKIKISINFLLKKEKAGTG